MKKIKNFKLILHYLKGDKYKFIIYSLLMLTTFVPNILNAYLWVAALNRLIKSNIQGFIIDVLIFDFINILVYGILSIPRDNIYKTLEIKFVKNASKELYTKINNLPAVAFEKIGVGEFVNRLNSDTDKIMQLLSKLVITVSKIAVTLVIFVILFKTSFIIGIELVVFSIIMGVLANVYYPKIEKNQEKINEMGDKFTKQATENISGIREIKALGIKKNTEKTAFSLLDNYFKFSKQQNVQEVKYFSFNNAAFFALHLAILITAGILFMKGHLEYSAIIMIEIYINRIDFVVESLSDFGVNFNKVTVALNRLDEILSNKLYPDEKYGQTELNNAKGVIEFKNINFQYSKDEENTLKKFNLKIEPNKKTAIVGRSGNGKSTRFNLLLRYFDTTTGQITIDGINIQDLTEESLRKNISIIRQSPFIFNMSIFDNLKIVKEVVKLEEICEVCKKAYIDDYIMSLPKGYDTIIGEGGVNLSGGQKQRLAIARTRLLNTKIILFDEATSALDNESQEYIKSSIDALVEDHTIIIVAHRLSTIMDADVINVIEKGHIVDSGTHRELMNNSKIYQNLYNSESLNS